MSNAKLNKLCMEESDPMLKTIVRCKHGSLLHMQTSWSKSNPGRRFWSCPYYGENNCHFFRWRDREEIDPRSQFILPKLVNKIKELEDEVWRRQIQINEQQVRLIICERRGSKRRKLKWCTFDWKVIFCILICVVALFINNLFQSRVHSSIELIELP
ncbi:hypothetical protein H5410_047813 [Solanum commersonii]|uniref:GRF-type domain-containing protein n=1 Tax=Solanum commersonii TaxID=4109 RepID=A0A9J5XG97_SOLCO|nr:hypothetical protein H5410_047813 [Solanum commersonii]